MYEIDKKTLNAGFEHPNGFQSVQLIAVWLREW